MGARPAARAEVVEQQLLLQLGADELDYLSRDAIDVLDAQYFAEKNALIVVTAEAY
ncbi:hypothetical protein VSR68_29720 [Paraburkholderia phymatum]|uniref:hypothetical protein n=1 Tax=Paraburkholderia phymatum TaxID=148447 RepID=UPI00316B7421